MAKKKELTPEQLDEKQEETNLAEIEADSAEEHPTDASAAKSFDIMPNFPNMDEAGIKDFFKEFNTWMRNRGATVRPLKVTEHDMSENTGDANDKGTKATKKPTNVPVSAVGQTKTGKEDAPHGDEGKLAGDEGADKDDEPESPSLFEAKIEWEYQDGEPVTTVVTDYTYLDALRGAARMAYDRRNEV